MLHDLELVELPHQGDEQHPFGYDEDWLWKQMEKTSNAWIELEKEMEEEDAEKVRAPLGVLHDLELVELPHQGDEQPDPQGQHQHDGAPEQAAPCCWW